MEQLVNIGVDYDVTAVDELFVEGEDYWQLDAVLGYNDDYTKVESVHRDFANMEGRDDDDLIFAFCKIITEEKSYVVGFYTFNNLALGRCRAFL